MSIDWKVKGNYLKFGIRTYVLPGSTIERVVNEVGYVI